jgi:ferrous iron transport protein B
MSLKIALAGNPNSGKTSLFNQMTGASQKVGNWSGVTVELIEGSAKINNETITIVDLPGTYSLSTSSIDEAVARSYIVEEKPDVVIDVIDATNLERHLYLTTQLLELGIRPILALNMWDEVKEKGITIDIPLLSKLFNLTILTTNGRKGEGIEELLQAAVKQGKEASGNTVNEFKINHPAEVEKAIDTLSFDISQIALDKQYDKRWVSLQLLEHDKAMEQFILSKNNGRNIIALRDALEKTLTTYLGDSPEGFITEARYGFVAGAIKETVKIISRPNRVEVSEKIDAFLTHRFWAYPIFFLFMWLLFQATFKLGEYPMGWIEGLFGWLNTTILDHFQQSFMRDLIANGVIAGVGGVAIFLPNILILFLGISIMEDSGYMARAAFIMDKLMHRIGLHGKSFIPMIMGLGCSVPAIMAARTLESKTDRIKTILLTPLISCSARLPVFILFAGALFPKHAGNIVFLFQIIFSFAAFGLMAILFKATIFKKSDNYPFVMELPPYRIPTFRSILIHMWHKTEHYLKKMGGVVLLFSVILWLMSEFPKSPQIEQTFNNQKTAIQTLTISDTEKQTILDSLDRERHSLFMAQTYIGRIGKLAEPLVEPFGTDWRGAVSLATGFVAKEIVVSSMGVLYAAGNDVSESSESSESLQNQMRKHFTPLSGFAFMLFVLLYTPCVVALITVIRELKNWRWSFFSVGYQLALAWTSATLVYQVGRLFGL